MFPIQKTGDFNIPSRHNGKLISFDATFPLDEKPKPVIVFIHGFKGFKDWGHFNQIAEYFANDGFVFIKVNLSHNGTTPAQPLEFEDLEAFGQNNFTIELDDVQSLINHLHAPDCKINTHELDLSRLYLLGHSRGGGIAILTAASDERIKAVTTWASMGKFEKLWKGVNEEEWKNKGLITIHNGRTGQKMPLYYQLYEDWSNNKERFNIREAVWHLDKPCLAIHGIDDETVPFSVAFEFNERNPDTELMIVEGANHTFGGYHPYDKTELPIHSLAITKRTAEFFWAVSSE